MIRLSRGLDDLAGVAAFGPPGGRCSGALFDGDQSPPRFRFHHGEEGGGAAASGVEGRTRPQMPSSVVAKKTSGETRWLSGVSS